MQYDILKNFGMAYYIHKAMQKTAEQAKKAVEYFRKKGVFDKKPCTK